MYRAGHVGPFSTLTTLKPGTKLLIVNARLKQLLVAFWAEQTSLNEKVVNAVYVPTRSMFKESLAFNIYGIAIGTNVVVTYVHRQARRANQDFLVKLALENAYVPELFHQLLRSS